MGGDKVKKLWMLIVILLVAMLIIFGCSASPSENLIIEGPDGPNAGKDSPNQMKVETLELDKTRTVKGIAEYTFSDFKMSETNYMGISAKYTVYYSLSLKVKNLGNQDLDISHLLDAQIIVSRNEKYAGTLLRKVDGEYKAISPIKPGDEEEFLIQVRFTQQNPNNQDPVKLVVYNYLEAAGVEHIHNIR